MRIQAAALLPPLIGAVAAAVDVVELLYKQQQAGSVAAARLTLTSAPAALIGRLSDRGVRWDELSGFLQRAMLWDLGLVSTGAGKLAQVLVPCGRTMEAVFLSLEDVQSAGASESCAVDACVTEAAELQHYTASGCSLGAVSAIAQCRLRGDTSVAIASSAGPLWAQHVSEDAAVNATALDVRVYQYLGQAYPDTDSNVSAAVNSSTTPTQLFTIRQVPTASAAVAVGASCSRRPTFVVPCPASDLESASDWCAPEPSSFLCLWIETERVASEERDAGSSRVAVALEFVLAGLALALCVLAGLYARLGRCKRDSESSTAGADHPPSRRVPFLGPLAARMATIALEGSEQHESLAEMQRENSYVPLAKEAASPEVNCNHSDSYSCSHRHSHRCNSELFVAVASSDAAEQTRDSEAADESLLRASEELRSFRSDAQLMKKRIPYSTLTFTALIARGAHGEVWSGALRGRVVAIKSLLPEKRHDKAAVRLFAHEIRLAASLSHPNIVRFLGLSWRRLADLCIVSELMAQGDLSELISSKLSGRMSWNREKLSIAVDMAEALAYLHSRAPCIIHRDLKSLNVLLDRNLRAKLSDFGLSRERSLEETMTSGVGTLLWTAPEILRGEPYAEKADVYSLGIVLSELDTCLPPFSLNDEASRHKLSAMQLLHLVTRAQLAPKLRGDCPEALQRLVLACAAPRPAQRPSARQIVLALRAIAGAARDK